MVGDGLTLNMQVDKLTKNQSQLTYGTLNRQFEDRFREAAF
jgi:hypothetical protein